MKRIALVAVLLFAATSCSTFHARMVRHLSGSNPYEKDPFWVRYLSPDNPQDREIRATLDALKLDPWSAPLHNQLGDLLSKKALPKWAEVEFDRAIASDHRFYPAWYNLGLVREFRGDVGGAMSAFKTTLEYKPGHAAAHFQLALLYERRGRIDAAIDHYAEAIRINPQLLSPNINPRVLDSRLIGRALMRLYPSQHSLDSINFEPTPPSYPGRESTVAPAATTAPPATTPKAQPAKPAPKTPPAAKSEPQKQPKVAPQAAPAAQHQPAPTGVVTTPLPVTGTAPAAKPQAPKVDPYWQQYEQNLKKQRNGSNNGRAGENAEPAKKTPPAQPETKPDTRKPKDPNQPDESEPKDPNEPDGGHSLHT